MKKFIYALLIAVSSAMVLTACTEEEIAPNTENGGAAVEDTVNRK